MTLPRNPNRQPQGVPTGGQFAASTHGEPQISINPNAGRPTDADLEDATALLEQRRENSWPLAAARHREEEGAWAASNAAVAARELFPNADRIEYNVAENGRIAEMDILKGNQIEGTIWKGGDGKYHPTNEWMEDRIASHLDERDTAGIAQQGAQVSSNPYQEGSTTVAIDIDAAILKAHAAYDPGAGPSSVKDASEALARRQKNAWQAAQDRHAKDETDWSASNAARNTREIYPDADEIEYTLDASGNPKELEVLSNGQVIGSIVLDEDGTVGSPGKSGRLNGPVLGPLTETNLDQFEAQGATIRDDIYDNRPGAKPDKIVNIRIDDVIMQAAGRVREQ